MTGLQELSQNFQEHKKEDSDNFGRLFNELKRNTDLTEAVVQRQSGLSSDLQSFSTFMGEVREFMRGNIVYMENLEKRTVKNREDIVEIDKKVSLAEGATKVISVVWGSISAAVVGVIVYLVTKHL